MNYQPCSAHEWAINADNSGECMRCGIKVASSAEASAAPRCVVHFVSTTSGFKPEPNLQGAAQ